MVWNRGKKWLKTKDLSSKLVEHSTYSSGLPINTYVLKNQLIKIGIKDHKYSSLLIFIVYILKQITDIL